MKKIFGIIAAVAILGAIVLILIRNKTEMEALSTTVADPDRAVAVRTVFAESEALSVSFSSNGTVQALKELNFVSDISGRVVRILVDKGASVKKGSPLLQLDSKLYEADYKAAKAALETMRKDEQRFSRSNEAGGVTAQQLDNIRAQLIAAESRYERSRKMYEDCTVKAPISGKINFRYVETGSLIAPNVPLFDIVDDSSLKIICNVPESKLRYIEVGQEVTLTSSEVQGIYFKGKVSFIGIKTDRGLNYPVEILLEKDPELKIGMYLKANFEEQAEHQGILVPRKAIVGSAKSANVYVVKDGKAELRSVILGEMYSDRIEVLSGVEAGDEIIVAGIMNVAEGNAVRIIKE